MAQAPKRPCTYPGCGALTDSGRCEPHKFVERKQADQRRGTSAQRGYGSRWQKVRAGFLRSHPLCQCSDCDEGRKRVKASTVVDHIKPHRGDMNLFWDPSNWQAMAEECHNRKTAREDGGFGNPGGVGQVARPQGS